jgi:hypothetical protein
LREKLRVCVPKAAFLNKKRRFCFWHDISAIEMYKQLKYSKISLSNIFFGELAMTWKRTLALIVSVIWIAICAATVFAQTTPSTSNTTPYLEVEHLSALAFDDMKLEDLLNIKIRLENSIASSNLLSPVVSANADFMEQVVVPPSSLITSAQSSIENTKENTKENIKLQPKSSSKPLRSATVMSPVMGYRKSRVYPTLAK